MSAQRWRWGVTALLALMLVAAMALTFTWWCANRPAAPVSAQEIKAHRLKAMDWLRNNESRVLADPNVALWWMLQLAGKHSGDPYLQRLTQMAAEQHFSGFHAREPWRRMLEPTAEVNAYANGVEQLVDYQKFFHHAMTCQPMPLEQGDTQRFMSEDMCDPMWSQVFWRDAVCTTHQIVGLMLMKQTGCTMLPGSSALQTALLDEVEFQLTWDPVVRDPFYQRLLVLAMNGRAERIKPVWLQRMLQSQEADGGWLGYRRIPELPDMLQPWYWRELIAQRRPDIFKPDRLAFDFHASAQAILLLTLLDPSLQPPSAGSGGS